MQVTCKHCKLTKRYLPLRSQNVTCSRCKAMVRVSVTFGKDGPLVAITPIEQPRTKA